MAGAPNSFGQSSNNPFGPQPFGGINPFGSQSGSSVLVPGFTCTCGASSGQGFRSSIPPFAPTAPAFGGSHSPFGGSSMVGHMVAFGGAGSTLGQASPFSNTNHQMQPAFGNTLCSTIPFSASTQPAFCASSQATPAFGYTTPAFGSQSFVPAFGGQPGVSKIAAFAPTPETDISISGNLESISAMHVYKDKSHEELRWEDYQQGEKGSSMVGHMPAFGGVGSTLGQASPFSHTDQQIRSAFGNNLFCSTIPFGASSRPAFGASNEATTFGPTTTPFGSQSSVSGFERLAFGGKLGGSKVAFFAPTPESDINPSGNLESISAMHVYKDKSHEELRWEDYQQGEKGSSVFGQKTSFGGIGSSSMLANPFGSTFQQIRPTFGSDLYGTTFGTTEQRHSIFGGQPGGTRVAAFVPMPEADGFIATLPARYLQSISAMPVYKDKSHEELRYEDYHSGFKGSWPMTAYRGVRSSSMQESPFGSTFQHRQPSYGSNLYGSIVTPAFGSTTTPAFGPVAPSLFGSTGTGFGVSSSPAFGSPVGSAFGSSSIAQFSASSTPAFESASSPLGSSSTPSFSFGTAPFGAQTTTPTFGNQRFGQLGQTGGSQVAAFVPTREAVPYGTTPSAGILESISAMPVYIGKSHEELRWEDYQRGVKGGCNPIGQPSSEIGRPAPRQGNPSDRTRENPFSSSRTSRPQSGPSGRFGMIFGDLTFGESNISFSYFFLNIE